MSKILWITIYILHVTLGHTQVTTSQIEGIILDDQSEPIPSSKIILLHQPTGKVQRTISSSEGSFFLANLTPGGPYTINILAIGYDSLTVNNVFLSLGETYQLTQALKSKNEQLKDFNFSVNGNDQLRKNKKGTSTQISEDQIRRLPTINRSIQDMTRMSPQAAGNSFAGSNYRYNNLSIDGVANNDAFGFQEPSVGAGGSTAAGSPGALAKTQPISLDAIAALNVMTAPYDASIGNFTGGSLNVTTKSGMNQTFGTVYGFGRNNALTGPSAFSDRSKIESFYNLQSGFSLGGAFQKNRIFYFVNAEIGRSAQPLLFAPEENGSIFALSDIQGIADTLQTRYGFNAGTFQDATLKTDNNKFFSRIDFILNEKHSLALRYNFVDAQHDNLSRSGTIFNFGSQGFTHKSRTHSVVGELKSQIKSNAFNKLIVGFSKIHDYREPFQDLFPHIEITYQSAGQIFIGSYREASIFQMHQNAIEISDKFTLYKNKHTFTFGTHNELYLFKYHFVTPFTGRWAYASLNDFYNDLPSRVRGTYHLEDGSYDFNYNRPSAQFPVLLSSVYAQDEFKVSPIFKITYGVRLETNAFLNDQDAAEDLANHPTFGQYTGGVGTKFIVAPRTGFLVFLDDDKKSKLRGGTGIFSGRMPFAWGAYSYIYNGNQFGSVDVKPSGPTPLITDNYNQLGTLEGNKREINLIDPNFKLPRVWRSSLAWDKEFNETTSLTIEGLYSKNLHDIFFQNVNLKEEGVNLSGSGNDDRFINVGSGDEQRIDSAYANVFLLTNTNLGYRYSLSASINKKWSDRFNSMIAYTYGMSKDLMNGVRVSAQANWNWNQTIDANAPRLSNSNFDIRHRIIANANYEFELGKSHKTNIGAFFIASSGSPFSYVYSGDINRDRSSKNDLIYVPNDASEINLTPITDANGTTLVTPEEQWEQLDSYISNDDYLSSRRGQYTERNGGRTPWNIQLDFHIGHEITLKDDKKHQLEITADIFNFLNLLNYKWGRQYFVPNTTNSGYALIKANSSSDGLSTTYQFINPTSTPWQIDGIASRMQMQVGLRYRF